MSAETPREVIATLEAGPKERHTIWIEKAKEGAATVAGGALLLGTGIAQYAGLSMTLRGLWHGDIDKALAGVGTVALGYAAGRLAEIGGAKISSTLAEYHKRELKRRAEDNAKTALYNMDEALGDPGKAADRLIEIIEGALPNDVGWERHREMWERSDDASRGRRMRADEELKRQST